MFRILIVVSLALWSGIGSAAEPAADEGAAAPPAAAPTARSSVTQHSVRIDGVQIQYTATAGWLIMTDDDDAPIARFGYTAYTRNGATDPGRRPIMFAFNGGPGSSSVWLHMGILGPRRVVINDGGFAPPPPARVVDNAFSVLDVTDLVMIDPVGTGFSKPLGEAEGEQFWGVDQDIRSVAAFIKQYVSENGRWASPKYLLGESYGGIRAAGLVWHLQNVHNMAMNGVALVSPFLNMGSGVDGANIDKPHVLYLSALAATAWYHDAIPDKPERLEDFVAEVERFAFEEYAPALLAGYTIDAERKQSIARRLAACTGVSADYWLKADLRITHQQFVQELKRDERIIAGRIDSRFSGPSINPLAEQMDYDPFFPSIAPAFTAGFLDYLHTELEFGQREPYAISAFGIDWDWAHEPPDGGGWEVPWADTRSDLAMAISTNPGLHVLVQQGYYDLATPITATRHDIAHLDIPMQARDRIRMAYYEAGHMMYLHDASMRQFRQDLADFVRDSDNL
jgi:carboxypeptidase C (cathepsin A)